MSTQHQPSQRFQALRTAGHDAALPDSSVIPDWGYSSVLRAWLRQLERRGVTAGVQDLIHCNLLWWRLAWMGELPADWRGRLLLLRPLLCRTDQQQQEYPSWLDHWLESFDKSDGPRAPPSLNLGRKLSSAVVWVNSHRWWTSLGLLVLLLGVGVWMWWCCGGGTKEPPVPLPSPAASAGHSESVNPTSSIKGVAQSVQRPLYVPQRPLPPPEVSGGDAVWLDPLRWVLVALGALSAAVGLWRLWRWWRRGRLFAQQADQPEDELLHLRSLRATDAQPVRSRAVVLRPVASSLRQQVQGQRVSLDVKASIRASIRQGGGAWLPRFVSSRLTPEYLALIDRTGPRDIQARFHEAMVASLEAQGVAVQVFYYHGNPDAGCWRLGWPDANGQRQPHHATTFAALVGRYAHHRLLVFGDTRAVVNHDNGQPLPWATLARQFEQRAWFTPLPIASWGTVENWVSGPEGADFLLLPMEEAALVTLAAWFSSGRAFLWPDPSGPSRYPPSLTGLAQEQVWLLRAQPPTGSEVQTLLCELRLYLGKDRMAWLAACAIFPALSWPLTVALGRQVLQHQASSAAGTTPHDDIEGRLALGLGVLAALPWFRQGRLPDWLREHLLQEQWFDVSLQQQLRQWLERYWAGVDPNDPNGEELARLARPKLILRFRSARGQMADALLLRFMEPMAAHRLSARLPENLRRLLFNRGLALLGLRSGVFGLISAPAVCLLLVSPMLWQWVKQAIPATEANVPVLVSEPTLGSATQALAFSPDGRWLWRAERGRATLLEAASPAASAVAVVPGVPDAVGWRFAPWQAMGVSWDAKGGRREVWHQVGRPSQALKKIDQGVQDALPFGWGERTLWVRDRASGLDRTPQQSEFGLLMTVRQTSAEQNPQAVSTQPVSELTVRTASAHYLALHPSQTLVAVLAPNQPLKLWEVEGMSRSQGELARTLQAQPKDFGGQAAIAFSPDGQTLAVVSRSSSQLELWNTANLSLPPVNLPVQQAVALAWAPNGSLLAVAQADGTLRLLAPGQAGGPPAAAGWFEQGQIRLPAATEVEPGQPSAVTQLLFTPDGASLLVLDAQGRTWRHGLPLQARNALPVAVLDCSLLRQRNALGAQLPDTRWSAQVTSRAQRVTDRLAELEGVQPVAMTPALWLAWGHGAVLPEPVNELVNSAPIGELLWPDGLRLERSQTLAAVQAVLARPELAALWYGDPSGGASAPGSVPTSVTGLAWRVRRVSKLRTPTVNLCGLGQPPTLATVPWPQVPPEVTRQGELRTALDDLMAENRSTSQREAILQRLLAESHDVADLLPLALKRALAMQTKAPSSQLVLQRSILALRLAQAASPVTLQRAAAEVYRLADALQGRDATADAVVQATLVRLQALAQTQPAPKPLLRLRVANSKQGTQLLPWVTRLRKAGWDVRMESAPTAEMPDVSTLQILGNSDAALGRWLVQSSESTGGVSQATVGPQPTGALGRSPGKATQFPVDEYLLSLPQWVPGTVERECVKDQCFEMVAIPSGSFMMGSSETAPVYDADETPQRRVTLNGFWMGRTEVTQGVWKAVMDGNNPSAFKAGDNFPVENISWDDAQNFVDRLNILTKKKYRLPSEAEWEYAARAGTRTAYWWGDEASHDYANYGNDTCCSGLISGRDKWNNTAPVGQFPTNPWGLYDMHGNVYEWVQDKWHNNYSNAPTDGKAWLGDGVTRSVRGGSWFEPPKDFRSASRGNSKPTSRQSITGMRLVRTE